MTARCPSDLALEELLLSIAAPAVGAHARTCARCLDRVAEMRRQGDEFLRYVFPATVGRIEEAVPGGGRIGARWLALLPAMAAGAVLLVVSRPGAPPDGYVAAKGAPKALAVFVQGGEGDAARPAPDGGSVPAAAALRFRVAPAEPCRLWIVSVDAGGQVSRLFPASGDGGAQVSHATEIPGGAVLDGRPGPERIVAVCSREPLPWARVERAVRSAAGSGAAGVRRASRAADLPGAAQTSVLLEKIR